VNEGERSAREYDAIAAQYAAENADNAHNAYYERPAIIALLGDVAGRRVLEAGCAAGGLTVMLAERGAKVTAFDVSPVMVEIARQTVRGRVEVLVADLSRPLEFASDGCFDLVVASLVMHYVRDWEPVLREFHRVLKPGGTVVFSTHHPVMDWEASPGEYFAIKYVTETWHKRSGDWQVSFWRRPLTAMCDAIASAGFVIERLTEPMPLPELASRDPDKYQSLRTEPSFLFFRLRPA
jgi:SAM-dependent methyltransferase